MLKIFTILLALSFSICQFVKRDGASFILNGKRFYYAGANAYNLFTKSKGEIDQRLSEMQSKGIKVIRTWGFSHEDWHGFEPRKGQYNEEQFQLFDYIMKAARDRNIYVIIALENYWPDYGGIESRLKWEGLPIGNGANRAKFYTNEGCKSSYREYIKHFVARKNTITGVMYKDDPTIFSWELLNEARYENSGEDKTGITLRKWTDEMASLIKSIDRNHMVTLGIEGHGSKYGYGGDEGNPFVYLHQSPYLDFATGHMYPDEGWANLSPEQASRVISLWIRDAANECKKPFILEEFNSRGNKQEYWTAMYKTMENFDGAGDNFWNFMAREESHGEYDIYNGHPILDSALKPHANVMNNKH